MNCDESRAAVLAGDESPVTDHHEQSCSACRSRADDLRSTALRLSDPAVWEEPSPELGLQIEQLISAAPPAVRVTPTVAGTWRWLAIAAALIAAVAVGMLISRVDSPDWEVALPATDLAPGSTAVVRGWNEEAGTRMVLAVAGLDPAPQGFMYEFWLSEGPIHVSAGTFRGSGEIELWSGVPRSEFPRLWVTLEPLDEDESPSGRTVLDTG